MRRTVSNLLNIARGEIGYCEKNTNSQLDDKLANCGDKNFTKYARDLNDAGFFNGNKNGFAWCTSFVVHCFWVLCGKDRAETEKMTCQIGDLAAGCTFAAQYYKHENRWFEHPEPGDQVFFGDYVHTGIVETVEDNYITTIEGNSEDKVERKRYSRWDKQVTGFGRPYYEEEIIDNDRFHTIDDIPYYAKEAIQFLVDNQYLFGKTKEDLDLSEDMVRMFVVNYRAGLYKEKNPQ